MHICVSFSTIRSGGFQSSSHQKHSVFKHFIYIYMLTMEWFLNLWFIKKDNFSKIHNIVDYFCYKCAVNFFFFFLQKNKTVPWWLKLEQNKTKQQKHLLSTACNIVILELAPQWASERLRQSVLSSSVSSALTKHRATRRTPQDYGPSLSCCLQCAIVLSFGKLTETFSTIHGALI